jgi:hypothetical protein
MDGQRESEREAEHGCYHQLRDPRWADIDCVLEVARVGAR